MDNPIYVTLSGQMILRRQLDVIANNLANVDTAGFKVESLISNTNSRKLQTSDPASRKITYALDTGLARDFTQGSLSQTGNSLDIGIDGGGFFKISTASGDRYTRDGRFSLDGQGRVITKAGDPLQSDSGDITVDPTQGPISIAKDGTISQGAVQLGKLAIYTFDNLSGLSKEGSGLFSASAGAAPQASTTAVVHQGMVESSNVQSILQITDMIEVSRAYSRMSQIIDQTTDLDRQSIDRLGKASA